MLLIKCDKCNDIYSATQDTKICKCGSTMAAITGENLLSFTGNPSILEIDDIDLKFCKKISINTNEPTKVPCTLICNTDKRLIKLSNKVNEVLM